MSAVILVGRRADGGVRDRLWEWCSARWAAQLGWPIVEGHHDEGPFSFAIASNRAAAAAGAWDVALTVGSDWAIGSAEQATAATALALASQQLVFAHDRTIQLTEDATAGVLAGDELSPSGVVTPNTFSGVTAIPRGLWDAVGGYDERFVGWGWEDLSLWSACCALAGYERVPGPIYHLWHPRSWEQNEGSPDHPRNQVLGERYLAAKHDREAMLAILAERC